MEMPAPDARIMAKTARIVGRLREVLPGEAVIDDPTETRAYECDALTAYRCPPLCAVLPSSTAEVAAVLRVCHEERVPVVPRGSGTSLAGGALPTADAVLLGVARLTRVLEVDYANRSIRVEAGRTNLSVTGAVEADGFFYAPDPSSQLACAIAGNVAMNSGGAHCLKYGVTTNNLLGVTMVLMDGTVVELGGPHLDPGGLDLLGVVCGSEGQLGVVTEATLRILPRPEGARPVLIGFSANEVAGACVADIIKAGLLPVAIEFMDRPCIEACEAFAHAGYPSCEALLIVEVEGSEAEIDQQLGLIKQIARTHDPVELREAADEDEAARIWLGRKSAFGAMGQLGDYICLDGTIPVSALPQVLGRIGELSEQFGLKVANVFHAGDGNMHPLILFDANKPGDLETCEAFGAEILKLCVEVGGCLSGEHGVGVEKRDLMEVQYAPADLEAQMRVKDVFDPAWLLNPAKVFPLAVSRDRREGGAARPPSSRAAAAAAEPVEHRPESEAAVAEIVSDAAGRGVPLAIRGGGTRTPGEPQGEVLSTAGLAGIQLYEPGALTLVVRAGTPLAEVEALLAAERQRLPFEPMDHRPLLGTTGEPTIGGVAAANVSGPRRVQVGAARDFLLGVRFVDGTGAVVKNGGRVMKNVTGYDLVKLFAGSHGTLGVLTELALKVLPAPDAAATLTLDGLDLDRATEAMAAALCSPFEVSGAAHDPERGTMLRLEGFVSSVAYRAAALADRLAPFGRAHVERDPVQVADLWRDVRDVAAFADSAEDVWRIGVRPSAAPEVARRLASARLLLDWGGGLIWAATAPGTDARAALAGLGGHATLVRADAATRHRLGTFQPQPAPVVALTEGLRARFDPQGVLNPILMA